MTTPGINRNVAWYRQVALAVPKHMVLKSVVTTVFITLFFAAYFYLLRHPAYPPTLMPVTALDRLIGFEPLALPLYVSLWIYVSILPVFFEDRQELLHYGRSMTVMCVLGLLIFYFWPTAAPSPDIDWTQYPDMDILKNADASGKVGPVFGEGIAGDDAVFVFAYLGELALFAHDFAFAVHEACGFGCIPPCRNFVAYFGNQWG